MCLPVGTSVPKERCTDPVKLTETNLRQFQHENSRTLETQGCSCHVFQEKGYNRVMAKQPIILFSAVIFFSVCFGVAKLPSHTIILFLLKPPLVFQKLAIDCQSPHKDDVSLHFGCPVTVTPPPLPTSSQSL